MYASYGCNGAFHSPINLPRYRPIYISTGNLSRWQKKKKKKNQYSSKRYSGWCIIIVHGNGRGEILDVLELVSSQPTPGTDRVRYFPQLAKRALKPEIMRNNETINRKDVSTNLCIPELLSYNRSAWNRWKKKFMAIRGNFSKRCTTRIVALLIKNKE